MPVRHADASRSSTPPRYFALSSDVLIVDRLNCQFMLSDLADQLALDLAHAFDQRRFVRASL